MINNGLVVPLMSGIRQVGVDWIAPINVDVDMIYDMNGDLVEKR